MKPSEKAKQTTKKLHGDDFFTERARKAGKASKSWWDGDSKKASELAKIRWKKHRDALEGDFNADIM